MQYAFKTTGLVMSLLMLAAPALADIVGVSLCDREQDGVFRPGLLTVETDGTRTFYPVGENGLTAAIVFNRMAAWEWVEAQGLFPEGTIFDRYDGYVCGMPCEDCVEPDQPDTDEPEPDDPEPDDPEPDEPGRDVPAVEPTD